MRSRDLHTHNQISNICSRLDNLEVVTEQFERMDIERSCEAYEINHKFSDNPYHLTWMEAQEKFSTIQIYLFITGAVAFIAGILYRLHYNKE